MPAIPESELPAPDDMLETLYQESLPVMVVYGKEYFEDDVFRAVDFSVAGLSDIAPEHVTTLQIADKLSLDFWPADESVVYRWSGTPDALFTQQVLSLEPLQQGAEKWSQFRDRQFADELSVNDHATEALSAAELREILGNPIENALLEHAMQPPITVAEAAALHGLMRAIAKADPTAVRAMIVPFRQQ